MLKLQVPHNVTRTRVTFLIFILGICLLLFIHRIPCLAGEIVSQVDELQSDTEDVKSASEKVLGEDSRIVPIPIPISNPTIGTGLAAALLYLHPKKTPDSPTTTTGVFGMYTDSQSWAVGAFHDGYYRDDRLRFRIPIVYGEFNLDFFGVGSDSPLRENPIEYTAVTGAFIPRLLHELPWERWYAGGQYTFLNVDAKFDISGLIPDAPEMGEQTQTAGLGLVTVYDSRDSNFWPSSGSWLDLTATPYGEYAGGDFNYFKVITKFAQYFPIRDTFTFVYRLDGQFITGDAPFWDLSRIRLRGYPGGQFLDDIAVTAQAEIRWNFYKRWTALAFGGGGRIADEIDELGRADTNYAGGGGLRFMLVEKQKLFVGIDVTYAEDGNASFYFQVGDWLSN
jgi:hypothetical protein